MNSFQTILLVIFGILAAVGTVMFSGFFSSDEGASGASELVMWGTIPSPQLSAFLGEFNKEKLVVKIKYQQLDEDSFDQSLIEALAEDRGPDMIVLPHDLLLRHQAKIAPVPYTAIDKRTYLDTFVNQAELFNGFTGTLGFPLFIDPLVMYWNRDLFTNAELVQAPSSWTQLMGITNRLTRKDSVGNITQSGVAMGGYSNISYAKDIVSALLLQAEETVIERDPTNKVLKVTLGNTRQVGESGASATLRFFTEFSNPTKPDTYSWNSSLRNSTTMFSDGDLAIYFAPWSEYSNIAKKNPHLNFDVATLPQREGGKIRATFGRMYAVAPLKSSRSPSEAIKAATILAQSRYASRMAEIMSLPPARRDSLNIRPDDPNLDVAYRSAIISRGWLDPDPAKTATYFEQAVRSITSGASKESGAVTQLSSQLQNILPANNIEFVVMVEGDSREF